MTVVAKTDKQPDVPGGLIGEDPAAKFKFLNVLFHGESGTGKTSILSSACFDPRTAPILVLDYEGGAPIRFAKCPKGSYTIRRVSSIADLNTYYDYLSKGDHPYKSVAIDSVTEVQKLGLAEFVYGPGTNARTFKDTVVNLKTAEIQHWGRSANQIGMLMRFFRDLPIHSFFTTLTVLEKDELTGQIKYKIALPGKQADEVPGIPDIVGYLTTQKNPADRTQEERVILFQPSSKWVAKDRTDALGTGIRYNFGDKIITTMLDKIYTAYGIE